ncbi:Hypothetical_protein [Hexamita inflata]|uniref:Hypothetical_protein n=1 Tax=Hexamita inflata TaxID=28002 RepID=A0AA86Q0U3_9EUKA|nr:Hypothetical protein HINF_LOCUS32107 [Hexamita inflata]
MTKNQYSFKSVTKQTFKSKALKQFNPKLLDSIHEVEEQEQNHTQPKLPQNNIIHVESNSCDLFWDQSCKTNVLMTKIKIVNGKKNYKHISIKTKNVSTQSTSNNSFFDIFKDDVFK